MECQHRAARLGDILSRVEDRFALLIAASRTGVDAPGGFGLAVNGEFDRAGDALLAGAIVEIRLQRPFGIGVIRAGFDELHRRLLIRTFRIRGLDFEFGQRARAHERPAGTAGGQIRVGEQFQPNGADVL